MTILATVISKNSKKIGKRKKKKQKGKGLRSDPKSLSLKRNKRKRNFINLRKDVQKCRYNTFCQFCQCLRFYK